MFIAILDIPRYEHISSKINLKSTQIISFYLDLLQKRGDLITYFYNMT